MSSISGALPSSPSVTAASPVANEDRSGENGDNDVSVKKKKKSSRKGRQPAKKRDGHNKKRSAKHKLVLQTLMVAIHNHGEQLGVTMQTYQLNPRVTRKKRKKYRKKWYRRGKHSHRKLLTKLIQNDPLMRVLWPLYSFIKTLFRKRKRKRKYLCNVQSSSSSLHGVIGKPFMPETVTPYGENALFRGETMPVRDKPQAGNPPEDSKNPADSGIATTSDTSGELKRKAEPQPDTSALATGSSSQHHHEDQIFTHPSSHGAHQIPPDSMLLIPSSHDDRIPLETELPPSHSCMFSEKEEFKQAASTFECCLGDERTWDDGLPPGPLDTKFNPPQPSASAVEV